MPSYTQSLYHVVFATKSRRPVLLHDRRREFLGYCVGIVQGMDSHVYRINCVEDHLHILIGLHSTIDISQFVKRFKLSSGNWIREGAVFPHFDRWQEKYGAFTVSWELKNRLIEYIKSQEEHHKKETFMEEFQRLLRESGLEWDERDAD